MQRLQSLDRQFLRVTSWNDGVTKSEEGKDGQKLRQNGRFFDAWSYLYMDEHLSEPARQMKKKVADFMLKVNPSLYEFHERTDFPFHLIPEIASLGVVGADYPKFMGGKDFTIFEMGSLMYEFARRDASIATFFLLHHSLGNYTVFKLAQPSLRDKIFKETLPLKRVNAWALTEPDNGSDASGLQSTAKKVEGGYLLNGKKRWIGNATFSDNIMVWARNLNEGGKVQCFLVKKGSQGLQTAKVEHKVSLRAVQNANIQMTDVFVPDDERFELATDFATGTKEVLMHSRIYVAWLATGIAAGAVEAAMAYCQERVQFKKPIAGFQLIQSKLVRAVALVEQSILLCARISQLYDKDHSKMTIGRIAMTKAECTRNCREVCQLSREAMGGNGICLENQAMKALCDIEAIHTYEGSHEINTLVAGREMTGLAAFK